jgi:hypothetical protein
MAPLLNVGRDERQGDRTEHEGKVTGYGDEAVVSRENLAEGEFHDQADGGKWIVITD